jgi:hypothetical protein
MATLNHQGCKKVHHHRQKRHQDKHLVHRKRAESVELQSLVHCRFAESDGGAPTIDLANSFPLGITALIQPSAGPACLELVMQARA